MDYSPQYDFFMMVMFLDAPTGWNSRVTIKNKKIWLRQVILLYGYSFAPV